MNNRKHLGVRCLNVAINNIKISLLFSDLFKTAGLNNYTSTINGIEQVYRQNESARNFRISLSYDFGNKKVSAKNRGFGNHDGAEGVIRKLYVLKKKVL